MLANMKEQLMESWWLIAISVVVSVLGQTIIKVGVSQPRIVTETAIWMKPIAMIVQSPLVMFGLVLYAIGALAWILVLSKMNLSYAYPFLALNFVLITVMGRVVLHEPVPTMRWFGLGFIIIGILIVSRST
jgi:multidrug transporter EmrE-like cation transporter